MIAPHCDAQPSPMQDHANCAKRSRHKNVEIQDDFEEAPSESFADITSVLNRRRPYRPQSYADDLPDTNMTASDGQDIYSAAGSEGNKDRFIELAQAALEEATLEDERKGVIQEVVEALIAKTGAPLVAEVISEQLRSQELIERLAESHEEDRQRRSSAKLPVFAQSMLKEPPEQLQDDTTMAHPKYRILHAPRRQQISDFIWRLFRLLLLSCVVGVVNHFVLAHHPDMF